MSITVDLGILTQGKVRLLSGHPRGVEARSRFDLSKIESENERIELVAPDDLEAITTSFVQGFFGESYAQLGGKEKLLQRYRLNLNDSLRRDFLDGLDRLAIDRSQHLAF